MRPRRPIQELPEPNPRRRRNQAKRSPIGPSRLRVRALRRLRARQTTQGAPRGLQRIRNPRLRNRRVGLCNQLDGRAGRRSLVRRSAPFANYSSRIKRGAPIHLTRFRDGARRSRATCWSLIEVRIHRTKRSLDYERNESLLTQRGRCGLPVHTCRLGRREGRPDGSNRKVACSAGESTSLHATPSTNDTPACDPTAKSCPARSWPAIIPSSGKSGPSDAEQSERTGSLLIALAEGGKLSVR